LPETALPATDLDLMSFLKAIAEAWMRRGISTHLIPAWYLMLVAVLGILSLARACGIWSVLPSATTACSLSLFLPLGGPGGSLRCHPRLDNRPDPRQGFLRKP